MQAKTIALILINVNINDIKMICVAQYQTLHNQASVLINGKEMKRSLLAIALLSAALAGCTAPQVKQSPGHQKLSVAGVGDAVYVYEYVPSQVYTTAGPAGVGGEQSWKQEILYSGMSSGELNFTYREFVNDFARPSFSQEAKYEYEEGGEVAFKGALIEVQGADNTAISYTVKSGFNDERSVAK